MTQISESEGRCLFGHDVQGYDNSRPEYPEWMFQQLCLMGALKSGTSTLEIGAGNGLATKQLIKQGASPLTLIEPDERFTGLLEALRPTAASQYNIVNRTLEECDFEHQAFDLIVIATAYHWLDPQTRIESLTRLTKQNGYVALLWNVFQDLSEVDHFHEATKTLLENLMDSPSGAADSLPFAMDRHAVESEFAAGGKFKLQFYAESHWQLRLDPASVRSLYSGFSGIARLPEEQRFELLVKIEAIAKDEFNGLVIRNMTSPLYVFQRR